MTLSPPEPRLVLRRVFDAGDADDLPVTHLLDDFLDDLLDGGAPPAGPVEIGRAPDVPGAIALGHDALASRRHCAVTLAPDGRAAAVLDLDSRHGTFVNGLRRSRAELRDGDVLRVGDTVFVARLIHPSDPPDPAAPLRARRDDVLRLFAAALPAGAPGLPADVAHWLVLQPWHGGVDELSAVARDVGRRRGALTLPAVEAIARAHAPPEPPEEPSLPSTRPAPGKKELQGLLEKHEGVLADIAREVGRSRRQVARWLDAHDLRADDFRRK